MADLSEILLRVQDRCGRVSGDPVPLDGGITNRNYRVTVDGRELVLRLPGKDTDLLGIDREAERLAARMAAGLGIAPELVYADPDCSLTVFVEGAQPIDPDLLRADPAPFARALRAFHDSGLTLPTRFWIPDLLRDYAGLLAEHGAEPPAEFVRARILVERIAAVLPLSEPVACHDDLLPGNLLAAGEQRLLVDWEYAGMGHRLFDLGNLAVNNGFDDAAEARLLAAYDAPDAPTTPDPLNAPTTPAPVIDPRRHAALKLMRLVSDAREAAWGVVQGLISDLDFDFGGYAEEHFERLDRAAADPRLEEYLRAATA